MDVSRLSREQSLPLGLPPELAERVAALLPPNEVGLTFRLVHKATAALAKQHCTARLSLSSPEHAFARYWSDPARCHTLTARQRRTLLRLTFGTGVIPNMEVAHVATGLFLRPADLAAAAGGDQLPAVQWLRAQGCPWDATALEAAAAAGHREMVVWLVEAGCPLTSSVLEAAVREGRVDMADQLMAMGCPISPEVYGTAARRGLYSFVDGLCAREFGVYGVRWLQVARCGQLLTGAAEGCSLAELQALYGRVYDACAARHRDHFVDREDIETIMQVAYTGAQAGGLLAAAAIRSRTPDWQAKTLWLVQDKGYPRSFVLDAKDEHGGPEHASRLEWLAAQGFRVLREGLHVPNSADWAAVDGDVEALQRAMDEEGLEVGYRWAYDAATAGHVGVVSELRARGLLSLSDAAHGAAEGGQLQLLEQLLDGVDGVGPRVDTGQGQGGSTGGAGVVEGDRPVRAEEEGAGEGGERDDSGGDPGSSETDEQDDLREALDGLLDAVVSAKVPSVELLRWLRVRGCPWGNYVFASAAGTCSVEAVEWMAAEGCPMGTDGEPYVRAAAQGDLAMLSCLRRLGCPWSAAEGTGRWDRGPTLNEALRMGAPLAALQWLDEQECPADFARALGRARDEVGTDSSKLGEERREVVAWLERRGREVEEERARFVWRFGPGR